MLVMTKCGVLVVTIEYGSVPLMAVDQVGPTFREVSSIWGVNSNDYIYKCKKPCNGSFVQVHGSLKQIDGGQAYVYGVNSQNNTWTRPVDGSGGWRQIPGRRLKHITASGKDDIFGISSSNDIYRCKKPCIGEWVQLYGILKQCDATFNALVGVNAANTIHRLYTGI